MTLREICETLEVSRRAIQGYENAGLVKATGRNKYGHLLYDDKAKERIAKIRFYQQLGLSIADITSIRGPIYNVVHQLKKKGKIEANGIGEYRICKQSVEPVKKGRMEFSNKQKNQLEVSIGNIEMYVDKYKKFDWINCSDEELQDARSNVTRLLDLAKKVEKEFKKI